MAKNVKSVTCASCGSRFKTVAGLRAHELAFHQGRERPLSIEAAAKEMDGYFKLWNNNANGKLGESPVPNPVPAPHPVPRFEESKKVDGAALTLTPTVTPSPTTRYDDAFTHKLRDGYRGVELPVADFPVELHSTPEAQIPATPAHPKFTDDTQFNNLFGFGRTKRMVPRYSSYGYSHKKKQRQMIAAMVAVMILMMPCAYYMTKSGMFIGITPYVVTPETPTSFEDVRDLEVVDAMTYDDIAAMMTSLELYTATHDGYATTYHLVIASLNVTSILGELREYAYTPTSFEMVLYVGFNNTYANTWAYLVPVRTITIECYAII